MKKWEGSPQHDIVDTGTIEAPCLDVSREANDLIILETVMIVHNYLRFAVNLPLAEVEREPDEVSDKESWSREFGISVFLADGLRPSSIESTDSSLLDWWVSASPASLFVKRPFCLISYYLHHQHICSPSFPFPCSFHCMNLFFSQGWWGGINRQYFCSCSGSCVRINSRGGYAYFLGDSWGRNNKR